MFLILPCCIMQVLDVTDRAAVAAACSLPPSGFDRVLVDAPCSGTGVLAKRADLRWRRELSDLTDLTALQARMPSQLGLLAVVLKVLTLSFPLVAHSQYSSRHDCSQRRTRCWMPQRSW